MAKPHILVTYASKMGSTKEIAEAIGRQLETSGMQVSAAPCKDRVSPEGFDAVIIGSAIYTRRWMKSATRYLKRYADRLDRDRTWLFHSGPCGEGAHDEQVRTPKAIERVIGPLDCGLPSRSAGGLIRNMQRVP
jgi:menaquinone-dependent protoporphyrinogen oxidase